MTFTPVFPQGAAAVGAKPLAVVWQGSGSTVPLLQDPAAYPVHTKNACVFPLGGFQHTVPALVNYGQRLQAYRAVETKALLAHARHFLAPGTPPVAIVVVGPSGAGKSRAIATVMAQLGDDIETHEFDRLPEGWHQSARLAILDLSTPYVDQMTEILEASGIQAALAIVFYLQPLGRWQRDEAMREGIATTAILGESFFRDPRPEELRCDNPHAMAVTSESNPALFVMGINRVRHPDPSLQSITFEPHEWLLFEQAVQWCRQWHALLCDDGQPVEAWISCVGASRCFAARAGGSVPLTQITSIRLITTMCFLLYYDPEAPDHDRICFDMEYSSLPWRSALISMSCGHGSDYHASLTPYLATLMIPEEVGSIGPWDTGCLAEKEAAANHVINAMARRLDALPLSDAHRATLAFVRQPYTQSTP